jgi:ABC-type Fe3+-hydroxamate transport system substrate-binding protein
MRRHIFTDARGRAMELAVPPERVISLVPSLTETLFELGLGERIVGVSRYCKYPADQIDSRTRVGGVHDPDRGKILSLEPDLIIANMEENRKEDIEFFEGKGLRVYMTFSKTVEDVISLIEELGELAEVIPRAQEISRDMRKEYDRIRKSEKESRPLRVFYPVWRNPYFSINRDTYIHHVLAVCGGENIFADEEKRYFPVTLETVAERRPEVILLPSEPYVFGEKHKTDFSSHIDMPAVRDGKVLLVDGEMVCWYGVRTREGLPYLRRLFEELSVNLP